MAEQQFFAAAVFAFLGLIFAGVLAAVRTSSLTSGGAKAFCWTVPAMGAPCLAIVVYEGLYGEAGGFRSIAMGLLSVVLWIMAVVLPVLQLAFGYCARRLEQSDK